jgi:xylulose-5-phosphate/fructose-6-phosphate phosphoketolase
MPKDELDALLKGYGHKPYYVEGDDPEKMHRLMAETLDQVLDEIEAIQRASRASRKSGRPDWPMIVLRSPKGWTGPKRVDGLPTENSWRSHQVPFADMSKQEHLKLLEDWMRSYKPEELFDQHGRLVPELAELAPKGQRRMGAIPESNGGLLLKDLKLPDFKKYAIQVPSPGAVEGEATRVLGGFLRDVFKLNEQQRNFRMMGPDETTSNRLSAVFEATARTFEEEIYPTDDHLAPDGRVMEVLSEHLCQGWL